MKTNLLVRFLIIIGVTVIASLIAYSVPPRLGIDLAGGTSLLYELDMSKVPPEGSADLAARVIEVLKRRVDPLGQKNMIWRVVEGKRIQIQMPYPSKQVQAARKARDQAEKELKELLWKQSEVVEVATKAARAATPAARAEILDKYILDHMLAPTEDTPAAKARRQELDAARADALKKLDALADATLKLDAAKAKLIGINPENVPIADFDAKTKAQAEFEVALQAAMSQSVDFSLLGNLMKSADSYENQEAQAQLAALPANYPLHKDKIAALVAARKLELRLSGGGVDSPEELKRLVTKAGVLDFRIAVLPGEIGTDLQEAVEKLMQRGPEQQVRCNGTVARWFEIEPNGRDNLTRGGYVTTNYYGTPYLLCYDDHAHTLTHSDPQRRPWSAQAGSPQNEPSSGGLYLPFRLDAYGGGYMGDLTSSNLKKPMAILLDDRAMTAPTIQSQINESGQITFGQASPSHPMEAILKEANDLKQIMDAGSLPATLQPEPISEETISSDMGSDNIESGLRASFIAVLAVIAFMMLYYTITGVFADIALMLNLVLVLAVMAMIQGTFTLPGIAGLVLTLGMAVDANVLINERIREEIHRGASLWMAVKQGYDKVFWTIFDSNLTTALTSVVLIFVGSEEVKGFGVTLLIGLAIQFFTALYVTRTFMVAAVKWGLIRAIDDHSITEYFKELITGTWFRKGHWPFMKVVTISNFDWIGKRHMFWVFSGVISVAGLVAFVVRGEEKYDIEFRGGTQVTFQLKNPLSNVVQQLLSLSAESDVVKAHPEMKNLADTLQGKKIEEYNAVVRRMVTLLAADQDLQLRHKEIAALPQMLKEAEQQRTLALDDVRKRITDLADVPGLGLGELRGARVYAVGNDADHRYKMETTIANAPQNLEATLPGPLGKISLVANPRISHDSAATQVLLSLVKQPDGAYPAEDTVQKALAALAGQPGLKDLAKVQVRTTGKAADHLVEAIIPNQNVRVVLLEPLADKFKDVLEIKPRLTMKNAEVEDVASLINTTIQPVLMNVTTLQGVFAKSEYQDLPMWDVTAFRGGAAIMLDNLQPSVTAAQLKSRIAAMRRSADFSSVPNREFDVIPLIVLDTNDKEVAASSEADTRPLRRAVLLTMDPAHLYDATNENLETLWRTKVATTEWRILTKSLAMEDLFEGVTSFDAVVAAQAKIQALVAIVVSLLLIVVYVWVRFGGIRYGIGAILSLAHDAIMALSATVLSGVAYNYLFGHRPFLLITDFKINLTMVAAYLTVIGYSVNDTIVIFDRVREMRGKSRLPLTPKLINDAINQCFGRTIWTSFTVFTVLLIMYIWGGDGIRGFAFAMLIGVITGVYSTLAIASPMLLSTGAGKEAPKGPSPFIRKDAVRRVPELPQESQDSPAEPEDEDLK